MVGLRSTPSGDDLTPVTASGVSGSLFAFHVEGVTQQTTYLPTALRPFDETYEIEGEHPAEALEKLVRSEIEWAILDSDHGFTITFEPKESDDE